MEDLQIGIINYGAGNLFSVVRAIERAEMNAVVVDQPAQLDGLEMVILPGVGSFSTASERLRQSGFEAALGQRLQAGSIQILGICLGMQLFFEESEEGSAPGMGWMKGRVERIRRSPGVVLPHVGWKQVEWEEQSRPDIPVHPEESFYFDHSYSVRCAEESVLARVPLGPESLVAAVKAPGLLGVQFHPELSSAPGLAFLRSFLTSTPVLQ